MMKRTLRKYNTTNAYQCNVCGRLYKYRNNLMSHKRNECGKEPCYPCPFCKREYRFKGSLTKHIQRVH